MIARSGLADITRRGRFVFRWHLMVKLGFKKFPERSGVVIEPIPGAVNQAVHQEPGTVLGSRRVFGDVAVEARDARTTATQSAEQRIRVVEGGRAYIAIGTAIPMSFRRLVLTPQGLTEARGTAYYDAVWSRAKR